MGTYAGIAEIANRGRELYRDRLQATIEPAHRGEYIAIDVESGDYALAADEDLAVEQIEQRRPDGTIYLIRVGYTASLFVGSLA